MSRSSVAQDQWRRIVQEHQSSGLSAAAFCRQRSISQPSFYAWKRRLGFERRGQSSLPQASFVAVKAIEGPGQENGQIELTAASFVELCLGQDRRLVLRRGFDRQLLLEVIAALEGLSL
jgi:transposase-like protein